MQNLSGKVAAVTGAGSGIGRALAINLAQNGCNVALSDVNEAGLAETVEMMKQYPVKITTQKLDVSDKDAFYAWADQVVADHGKANLVFNNAGVALAGTVGDLSIEDYKWIMDINFYGVLYGTKAFLPHMEAAGEGHIVNISSIFGLASQPLMSGYNASKFAVRGLTESLRQDLDIAGSCVSTTCVHPGGIKTNIAQSTRFNEKSSEITGASADDSKAEFERLFITTPDKAAKTIINGVKKNKRRVLIGPDAVAFDLMVRTLGSWYQKVIVSVMKLQANQNRKKNKTA
ncbi:MAG: SDR family NAD(P)-dependent oxidoreductase [Thalassolituus maritimus]|jgi:NADP-dependent 3-hydroxy acid dehydrogenase YdfG|uniref:NADP-dependent 3-hydroxy acid dehydrogenase YdfG n=1 Tax=Thalassolituus maritimus TaxID=484498 RepID=A0A1N7MKS5_9GAMM|nr:SDR family NAD(P)-dependent oxidoreductase [Thalassolituus maritimus]TPD55817.1 MAG: SDR family NAD(P)-dependent oxidoreductase [Thalassolituus maritimus]SIS86630.1 NADP-dependent 3-hydroxy acid dehydrogenase YdfG [Thalassolituus maritimus]